MLRNNRFNGSLNLGEYSSQLSLINLEGNYVQHLNDGGYNKELILIDNPHCYQRENNRYCTRQQPSTPMTYLTPTICGNVKCPSDQETSTLCACAYPLEGTIYFRLFTFSDTGNATYYKPLQQEIRTVFLHEKLQISDVTVQNPCTDDSNYLHIDLRIFPSQKIQFDKHDILMMLSSFSNYTVSPPQGFGPYYFNPKPYGGFQGATEGAQSRTLPVIVGASVGGAVVLLLVIIGLTIFALKQKKKAKQPIELNQASGSLNPSKSIASSTLIKGPRSFTFEEMMKFTENFSAENEIGSGGYGKVYRGMLPNGQLIAVKRGGQESMQGGVEFNTEIEMLSRVHHKNLVSLIGFCFEQDEQILVYEYVANGTLKDSLTGKSPIQLDWNRRLRIALCTARGLTYLHELANPPVIHRDVKPSNILLDQNLDAKVSDFGLSKHLNDKEKGYVTTQVKGTIGYLDPEYYITQQLTEKSDVYSFGVLLLEIVTARKPIERGKYIVREIKVTIKRDQELYNLHELIDPALMSMDTKLIGFERFIDLAMRCVEESSLDRPIMSDVTKEIENIMIMAGLNPSASGSTSTTASFVGSVSYPYTSDDLYGVIHCPFSPRPEPK